MQMVKEEAVLFGFLEAIIREARKKGSDVMLILRTAAPKVLS